MNNAAISKCATIMLVMGLSYFAYCDGAASNAVSVVRTKIDNCVAVLPHDGRGDPGYMREFGLPGELRQSEIELGLSVSNNIEAAYMNFSVLATNLVERRLLLASTWRLGDDFYLDCLSRNVDLAIAGVITADDLEWYMRGAKTEYLAFEQFMAEGPESPLKGN